MPFDDHSINKVYTVNTVYFWQDIHKGLLEIKRVLQHGGLFLNVLRLKEAMDEFSVTQYGFTKYTFEQIEKATVESGLKIEHVVEIQSESAICVVVRKE